MPEDLTPSKSDNTQPPSTLYDELRQIAQETDAQEASFELADRAKLTEGLKRVEAEDLPTDELIGLLIDASNNGLDDELSDTLRTLRIRRKAGDRTYRINDPYTYPLDKAIVSLAQKGQLQLAKELITASDEEEGHMHRIIDETEVDPTKASELKATIDGLCHQKQSELKSALIKKGASDEIVGWLVKEAPDPDSSVDVPADFWGTFKQDRQLRELLAKGGADISKSAGALQSIAEFGLQDQSDILLRSVIGIASKEEQERYLKSLGAALKSLDMNGTTESGSITDKQYIVQEFAKFEDPLKALKASKIIYGDIDPQQALRSFYNLIHSGYGMDLAAFTDKDVSALVLIKEYSSAKGISDEWIRNITSRLIGTEDFADRAKNIVEGLRLAGVSSEKNIILLDTIARSENPIELGRAASIIEPMLEGKDMALRQDIQSRTFASRNPEATAVSVGRSIEEINKHGLTIQDIGVKAIFEIIDKDPDSIERYCSDWKIGHESEQAYQEYWRPARETGLLSSINIESKPKIVDLPELSQRLEKLGISPQLAQQMFASWASYSSLRRRLYKDNEMRTSVNPEDIDGTLAEQGKRIVQQAEALTTYVERFGSEEAIAIIETFGIYNFMRYQPELLHEQLISWKSGALTVKNVVVGARSDWNGAVDDVGSSFHKLFGDDGLFFFEANDSTELAKVAVAVGNRERANGRIPEEVSGLENLVIDGHANPEGILLGTEGQRIDTDDYLLGLPNGQKSNNYQRHLGKRFRVILKACSTAGEVAYGKNIAESIADYHDVKVEASKEITSGSIIIDPDGTVRFNGGDVPSTVYT